MDQYRKSPRANFIDYDFGDYFITICAKNKKHYFGEIIDSKMILSEIGIFVDEQLKRCSEFCPHIQILLHTVMPNHIHFIASLSSERISNESYQRRLIPAQRANPECERHVPALSRYISSLKGSVSKYAKLKGYEFGWQVRYHDHLIRSHRDGNQISEYIINNALRWKLDCFF